MIQLIISATIMQPHAHHGWDSLGLLFNRLIIIWVHERLVINCHSCVGRNPGEWILAGLPPRRHGAGMTTCSWILLPIKRKRYQAYTSGTGIS